MKSYQADQDKNSADKAGKENTESGSRGGTIQKDNMNPAGIGSEQSGRQSGSQQGQQGQQGQQSQSGDLPGPGARGRLAADDDMDEDTGLSNRANRQSADQDQRNKQSQQSNVGRRDDGTPD